MSDGRPERPAVFEFPFERLVVRDVPFPRGTGNAFVPRDHRARSRITARYLDKTWHGTDLIYELNLNEEQGRACFVSIEALEVPSSAVVPARHAPSNEEAMFRAYLKSLTLDASREVISRTDSERRKRISDALAAPGVDRLAVRRKALAGDYDQRTINPRGRWIGKVHDDV